MELLIQFTSICIIGALLYTAFWVYTKIENIIKQRRKIFITIYILCFIFVTVGSSIVEQYKISSTFLEILLTSVSVFSFYLLACIIFSIDKKKKD